jgi:hypothetical protein
MLFRNYRNFCLETIIPIVLGLFNDTYVYMFSGNHTHCFEIFCSGTSMHIVQGRAVLARVGPVGGLQQQAQPKERPHQVRRGLESGSSDPDSVHFRTRYPDLM